jgi:carbamate kinase
MRIVAALGGNALLERGEPPESEIQEKHILKAVSALAPLAREHELVITHGNGPQVGLLALESAGDPALAHPYPLDVLGAQTQGMIGYWLVQALQNALPGRQVACLVSRTLVSAADPAFDSPSKLVGPVYTEQQARQLADAHGWDIGKDGPWWRRIVPSPEPVELLDLHIICTLEGTGVIVICAGGGGVPVVRTEAGRLRGVEAVVDKDLTAALLAQGLGADALLLLTDVAAVEDGFGTPHAQPIHWASPGELRTRPFPAGSMGPKVEAVCRFVEATGKMAGIGQLADAGALLRRDAGTTVTPG